VQPNRIPRTAMATATVTFLADFMCLLSGFNKSDQLYFISKKRKMFRENIGYKGILSYTILYRLRFVQHILEQSDALKIHIST